MKRHITASLIFLVCALQACPPGAMLPGIYARAQANSADPMWTHQDAWYRRPTKAAAQGKWTQLKESEIIPIMGQMAVRAEQRLQKLPVVKMTTTEAENLSGTKLAVPEGKTAHLVRAVYLNEGTGKFSASYRDRLLWIRHGSLGGSPVPMKRRAVIVFLKNTPNQVFATCWMVE